MLFIFYAAKELVLPERGRDESFELAPLKKEQKETSQAQAFS